MCGIITIIRKDKRSVVKQLLKTFERQRSRGTEGFGFCSFQGKRLKEVKRFETEITTKKAIEEIKTSGIIFHHRIPTSTPNYRDLAHPIKVDNKNFKYVYYVVHNGIISNSLELRTRHEKEGFTYTTICKKIYETLTTNYVSEQFNDSESLAIEIAKSIENKTQGIQDVKGSIAFICLQTSRKGNIKNIYYGRNEGNPLILDNQKDFFRLSSVGNGKEVETEKLFKLDLNTLKITQTDFKVGTYPLYKEYKKETKSCGYSDYDDYVDRKESKWNKDIYTQGRETKDDLGIPNLDYTDIYDTMPKNKCGYVWLSGLEKLDDLEKLYIFYEYKRENAEDKGNDKVEQECEMRLFEIDIAMEVLYHKESDQERIRIENEERAIEERAIRETQGTFCY